MKYLKPYYDWSPHNTIEDIIWFTASSWEFMRGLRKEMFFGFPCALYGFCKLERKDRMKRNNE
tara:strand:- start:1365 stop:1553 length:189 start_codon:yes stop_codon:yes gene_type:complete